MLIFQVVSSRSSWKAVEMSHIVVPAAWVVPDQSSSTTVKVPLMDLSIPKLLDNFRPIKLTQNIQECFNPRTSRFFVSQIRLQQPVGQNH